MTPGRNMIPTFAELQRRRGWKTVNVRVYTQTEFFEELPLADAGAAGRFCELVNSGKSKYGPGYYARIA